MHALLQGGPEDRLCGPVGTGAALPAPRAAEELAAHYDLTISHPAIDMPAFAAFDRWLAEAAARRGLACALIHDGIVAEVLARLGNGRLTIGFHLDYFALWHVPDHPYARLATAVQRAGGRPVNDPARSRLYTDKAAAHRALCRHGLATPATVLLEADRADERLSVSEEELLGLAEPGGRIYVKPANGFGGRGVCCVDRDGLAGAVADARRREPRDAVLLQRAVRCPLLTADDGSARLAYWRVLCCLGEMIPFWWQPHEPGRTSYQRVTRGEVERHGLHRMLDYVADLAALAGLDWFSTEVCLSDTPGQPVTAIDYVNDHATWMCRAAGRARRRMR